MISATQLPTLNAALNSLSALFLYQVAQAQRACIISACASSTLFLISYLVCHYQVGSVPFKGSGAVRVVYFAILISHPMLAAAVVPPASMILIRALKERFDTHWHIALLYRF